MNAPLTQFKPLKPKKCKNVQCKQLFTPSRPLQSVCSPLCAIALVNVSNEKNNRLERVKMHKEVKLAKEKIKTRQEHLHEAQRHFNRYIRIRDADDRCISCEKTVAWGGQWHASHYRSVGACPQLRFNELNNHKSCSQCNNFLSGNLIEYRIKLIKKIGFKNVEWLESHHELNHYSIEEIKAIKGHYKKLCKELEDARH